MFVFSSNTCALKDRCASLIKREPDSRRHLILPQNVEATQKLKIPG
jgi:hypothetical protein